MILISSDVFISTRTNLPWFSFFRASSSLFAILAFSTSSVLAERKKDVKVTVDAMLLSLLSVDLMFVAASIAQWNQS